MRSMIAILLGVSLATSCSKSAEEEGREAAKKAAEEDLKAKEATGGVAKKIRPPVPGRAHVPCTQLLDLAKFGDALGEKTPMTMEEVKDEADAAAGCALKRGGKHASTSEQTAKIKKEGLLGILPGDVICTVYAFCWTIEDADRFKTRCGQLDKSDKLVDDLGFPACLHINPQGEWDVRSYRFFDEDTKCIVLARPGPSNVDNDLIAKCAKAAHEQIGPQQIAVTAGGSAQ